MALLAPRPHLPVTAPAGAASAIATRTDAAPEAPPTRRSAGDPPRVLAIAGTGQNGATLVCRLAGSVQGAFAVGEIGHLWSKGSRSRLHLCRPGECVSGETRVAASAAGTSSTCTNESPALD